MRKIFRVVRGYLRWCWDNKVNNSFDMSSMNPNPVDQVSKKDREALEYLLKTVFENQHQTSDDE